MCSLGDRWCAPRWKLTQPAFVSPSGLQYWRLADVALATRERVLAPLQSLAGRLASLDPPALEALPDHVRGFVPRWIEQLRYHILDAARRPQAFTAAAFQAQVATITDELGRLDKDLAISLLAASAQREQFAIAPEHVAS